MATAASALHKSGRCPYSMACWSPWCDSCSHTLVLGSLGRRTGYRYSRRSGRRYARAPKRPRNHFARSIYCSFFWRARAQGSSSYCVGGPAFSADAAREKWPATMDWFSFSVLNYWRLPITSLSEIWNMPLRPGLRPACLPHLAAAVGGTFVFGFASGAREADSTSSGFFLSS